eukprot:5027664-Amphidinium_carterae.1
MKSVLPLKANQMILLCKADAWDSPGAMIEDKRDAKLSSAVLACYAFPYPPPPRSTTPYCNPKSRFRKEKTLESRNPGMKI